MIETITNMFTPTQIDCIERFAERLSNHYDASLVVFDKDCNCATNISVLPGQIDTDSLYGLVAETFESQPGRVIRFAGNTQILSVGLKDAGQTIATAIIVPPDLSNDDKLRSFCSTCFEDMLTAFAEEFCSCSKATSQLEVVSTELSQTYEELILLYNMSTNMKVTQSNATYLQMACDQITKSVNVQGIAVFIEKKIDGQKQLVLNAGSGLVLIDQYNAEMLQVRLQEELDSGKDALLDSNIESQMKYEWPEQVESLIAVPFYSSERMIGFMVATNIVDKPDFDSIDIKLFNSVANQCAVFIENVKLFGDLKDLFIGSLKALTNSIDAKDQYTRGHSERVAFISRWISERLAEHQPVSEDQIHTIYLAGLLHDIGKIGINEAILQKKGKLSEEDMKRIRSHPEIGASILVDIKQMKEVTPGVLCHHERPDGKGYPDGLKGDEIPLIGKIIGLADAFDAMTSRRVYRDAMSIKHAISEIEKALGTQFDEQIGRIFIESDIHQLWSIIQDGFIESWDYSNFAEYGSIAVGSLLK
jgi:HD-GYP domain-containing protein (c-di-GMP phosphodiesterase class II)